MMEMKKDFAACEFDIIENADELRKYIVRIQSSKDTDAEWKTIKDGLDNNPQVTMEQLRERIQKHLFSSLLKDKWQSVKEDVERMIPFIWCDNIGRTTGALHMIRVQEMILFGWAKEYYAHIPEHDKIDFSKLLIRDNGKKELLLRIQKLVRNGQWKEPASSKKILRFFCVILGVTNELSPGHEELPNMVYEYLITKTEDQEIMKKRFDSQFSRFLGLFYNKGYFYLRSDKKCAVQISKMIFGETHKMMNLEIGKGYRKDEDRFRKICEMAECYLPN